MKTNDKDIRKRLVEYLEKKITTDEFILHELGICLSATIADVVFVDDKLHGYEIKSDRDTLQRLSKQVLDYNKVFDTMTLVVSSTHLEKSMKIIPEWWGVICIDFDRFDIIRTPQINTHVEVRSCAELLWSNESEKLLREYQLFKGLSGKARRFLWDRISLNFDHEFVRNYIINCFKTRENWK